MFEINNVKMHGMLDMIFEQSHTDNNLSSETLCKELEQAGYDREIHNLWELEMLRQQKPRPEKVREDIDAKMVEIQLNQLENEIKECLRIMQTSESFSEEVYKRYETLKNEKDLLLDKHTFN